MGRAQTASSLGLVLLAPVLGGCSELLIPPSFTIEPAAAELMVNDSLQLELLFPRGTGNVNLGDVQWRSRDTSVAIVSSGGMLRAVGFGATELEARLGMRESAMTLTVYPDVAGSWSGENDTVIVALRLNRSAAGGFTGLGGVRFQDRAVPVTASGSVAIPDVVMHIRGDGFNGDYVARFSREAPELAGHVTSPDAGGFDLSLRKTGGR